MSDFLPTIALSERQRETLNCIAAQLEIEHREMIARITLADGGIGHLHITRIMFAPRPAA